MVHNPTSFADTQDYSWFQERNPQSIGTWEQWFSHAPRDLHSSQPAPNNQSFTYFIIWNGKDIHVDCINDRLYWEYICWTPLPPYICQIITYHRYSLYVFGSFWVWKLLYLLQTCRFHPPWEGCPNQLYRDLGRWQRGQHRRLPSVSPSAPSQCTGWTCN